MTRELLLRVLRENGRLLIAVLVAGLICLAVWSGVLYEASRLEDQRTAWNQVWQRSRTTEKASGAGHYLGDRGRLEQIYATIPATYELPEVIDTILDFAAKCSVQPGTISYKQGKSDLADASVYHLNFSASGSYPYLKRLVADLERLDGVTVLEAVTFSRKDPVAPEVELDARLTIYLRETRP